MRIILFQQQFSYGPSLNKAIKDAASSFGKVCIGLNTDIIGIESDCILLKLRSYISLSSKELILVLRGLGNGYIVIPAFALTSLLACLYWIIRPDTRETKRLSALVTKKYSEELEEALLFYDDLDIYSTFIRFSLPNTFLASRRENRCSNKYIGYLVRVQLAFKDISRLLAKICCFYITVYYGYIQHATPARSFLLNGKYVATIGSPNSACALLANVSNNNMAPISPNKESRSIGKQILSNRVRGHIDSAISYVPASPYGFREASFPLAGAISSQNLFVCIYMHEFTDFHHDNGFPAPFMNYYEWLDHTYTYLVKESIPFTIKLHPSLIFQGKKYKSSWELLLSITGGDKSIFTDCSTPDLIKAGLSLGVTAEGTIAVELAYLGVACLALQRAPYADFSLCYQASSLKQYNQYLREYAILKHQKVFRKNAEIYAGSADASLKCFHYWSDIAELTPAQIDSLQSAKNLLPS
jgi:hypothetical protein